MSKHLLLLLWLCHALVSVAHATEQPLSQFSFGVIAHPFKTETDESALRNAIKNSDADNLAFVVVNGIKSRSEPCSDKLYATRKSLLNSAQNGLIVSLAGSDWTACANDGQSAAMERLNRVRELFFVGEFSFGASKIPLLRQSSSPRFRSYGENARWELKNILFATINLPENNNHYLTAAGRNNEFEDRLIANEDWLQRIVSYAIHNKMKGVVLFSDANPLAPPTAQKNRRDGFLEVRRCILKLASSFQGKILLIHNQSTTKPAINTIKWHGNLGELSVVSGWSKMTVTPGNASLFSMTVKSTDARNTPQ